MKEKGEARVFMTIGEIVERSGKIDQLCEAYSVKWLNENIFGVMEWSAGNRREMMSDVLYVTTDKELPCALPGDGTYNFLLCLEEGQQELTIPDVVMHRCNIITSRRPLSEVVDCMERVIFNERRIESAMRRITEAMFVSGMEKMIAVGAEQMGCPIVLADNSGTILERYKGKFSGFEGCPFLDRWDEIENATELFELEDACQRDGKCVTYYSKIAGTHVFYTDEKQRTMIMSVSIRVSKIEVGKIFAFLKLGQDLTLEEELLYRLSLIIGETLQKNNHFHINHRQRYVNLMWMLLEGNYPNLKFVECAMEELNIKFRGKCRLALIHIISDKDDRANENDMLHVLSSQVNSKFSNVLWVIHNQDLVLLFNLNEKEDITDYEISLLKKIAEANEISIGVSHAAFSLSEVRQLYWQAKEAAEFGHEINNKNYTRFEEISHFSMFRLTQSRMDCMCFVDPGLKNLFLSKKESMQEYVLTLYYYLKYDGNTGCVAKKTHVHRNTVLYRIDKLQDKMGFELGDGMAKMKLMLSFEILKYMKIFHPEE